MTVVVLDTNELQSDWLFKGLKFQLVRHGGFSPPLQVCVPAVVLEELVANHTRAVDAATGAVEKSVRTLKRLGVTADAKLDSGLDYRAYLLERFDEVLGVDVLDWPDVHHRDLVARAVSRTPPFNSTGGGYRDALVWADVVKLATDGRHVALVSNDKAFADGDTLADTLTAEVADLPGSVELVRDFGAWLVRQVPWKVSELTEAVTISRDAEFGEFLSQSDFLYDIQPEDGDLGFAHTPYSVTIEAVEYSGDTRYVEARTSPDGATLVEYDIGEYVDFDAELAAGTAIEDDWELIPASLPGRIRARGRVLMIARVGVLYDDDSWSIDELSWRRADGTKPGRGPFEVHPDQLTLIPPFEGSTT